MRSRYTAYTLNREAYLLATWHESTRPLSLPLSLSVDDGVQTKWLGVDVKRHDYNDAAPDTAIVEFIARFKVGGGRTERLHEVSRFVREAGRWAYVDGELDGADAQERSRKKS